MNDLRLPSETYIFAINGVLNCNLSSEDLGALLSSKGFALRVNNKNHFWVRINSINGAIVEDRISYLNGFSGSPGLNVYKIFSSIPDPSQKNRFTLEEWNSRNSSFLSDLKNAFYLVS